jgi:mRNA interferase RelE/StbE
MEPYEITLKPSVEKDLRKLPSTMLPRILNRLEDLKVEPLPSQAIKLSGTDSLYRIRVGDYRIVYEVDTPVKRILIQYIRHRREVYRDL